MVGLESFTEDAPEEDEDRAERRRRFEGLEQRFTATLQQQRTKLAAMPLDPHLPLLRNLEMLAELLNLSLIEQAIVCFAVLLDHHQEFNRVIAVV